LLGRLTNSESSFKQRKHSLNYVVGLCGINTRWWNRQTTPFNPYNDKGNIYMMVHVLNIYLEETDGNVLRALTKYKGDCSEGLRYAKGVYSVI